MRESGKPFGRHDARRALRLLVAACFVFWSKGAFASRPYPVYLQQELTLPAKPDCILCHTTNLGGKDTATQPFGFSMSALGVGRGSSRGTVAAALADSEEQRIDSDGDGVIDIDEIRMGDDPNLGIDGARPPTLIPKTGCGMARSPVGSAGALGLILALGSILWLRRRSARQMPPLAGLIVAVLTLSRPALAAGEESADVQPEASKTKPLARSIGELGAFGGLMLSDSDPELAGGPEIGRQFTGPQSSLGGRLLLLPLSVGGVEGEFDHTNATTRRLLHVSLWQLKAHLYGQLPLGMVTPFALAGLGSVRAVGPSVGDRSEALLEYGVGLKVAFNPAWLMRLDVRDTVTDSEPSARHHPEILLGFSLVLRPPSAWSSP
jgi:hypothetical protein